MRGYFNKTELKGRGWTDSLIKRFMASPDKTFPNPLYKNGAPMCFYDESRTKEVEDSIEFKDAMEASNKRKKSAKQAVETKKDKVIEWVNGLTIEIPDYDKETLIKEACEHFNARKKYQKERYDEWALYHYEDVNEDYEPDFSLASPKSEDSFLARITTNYLRHCITDYEDELERLFGKTGKDEGHDFLQARINAAIHEKYPWTANYTRLLTEFRKEYAATKALPAHRCQ